jgi:hypothetical protein
MCQHLILKNSCQRIIKVKPARVRSPFVDFVTFCEKIPYPQIPFRLVSKPYESFGTLLQCVAEQLARARRFAWDLCHIQDLLLANV